MLAEILAIFDRDPGLKSQQGNMLCCMCGARMQYNPTATCGKCLKSRVVSAHFDWSLAQAERSGAGAHVIIRDDP
jgi:predicted amidophosphoribosyltransferase